MEIAIDLANGVTETISAETWSGIDPTEAIEAMVATIEPDELSKCVGHISLRRLANMSDPLRISDSTRERLAKVSPEFLAKIEEWQREDIENRY